MRRVSLFAFLLLALSLSACAEEGPSAYVTFNLRLNTDCVAVPTATANTYLPFGVYDIAPGGTAESDYCVNSYYLNLLVNSHLRPNSRVQTGRAEPNVLQLHSAEVRLMSVRRETIQFNRGGTTLPNPFLVTTANSIRPSRNPEVPGVGVASIEAIPAPYAAQLNNFTNQQILAEIQIFGTTTGAVDIDIKPFVYPIRICDGCQTVCYSSILTGERTLAEIYGRECNDDAGYDGRICVDRGC